MPTFESKGVKLDVARFVDDSLRRGDSDIYQKVIAAVDDVVLERILRHANGNQVKASKLLGISRTTLRAKLRDLGLEISSRNRAGLINRFEEHRGTGCVVLQVNTMPSLRASGDWR
jgi:DNA-binding protein Fis